MTRKSVLKWGKNLPSGEFSHKCSATLDNGAETYRSINELGEIAEAEENGMYGENSMALDEMESVLEHLASASAKGDYLKAKMELESRNLTDIL